MNLEELSKINIDKLTLEQRQELARMVNELKLRQTHYPILDYKPQSYQQEFLDAVSARNPDGSVKYKFIIFMGGNGTGKTQTCAYLTQLLAMGRTTKDFNLPYIGQASIIKVVTSAGSQIMENIEPYILGTETMQDDIKFPGYFSKADMGPVVKKVRKDKDILKQIELKNGCTMFFGSYEQGQAILQGGSPDITWIDEVPTRWKDFRELIRGTRKPNAQFIMSFTPTNYNKKIYDWVYGGQENKFLRQVDAFENKFADHSWMEGLSPDELQIVRFGKFTPPSGLVYKNFKRDENMIEHIAPRLIGTGTKFYGALDFGVKHPMAFLFIAVTGDGTVYVFDMIHKSDMLLGDLVKEVKDKCNRYGIDFEYIVADSAGARERSELSALGMHTRKANKKKKEGAMSNRRAGIMKINQMLYHGKIIISDKCEKLAEEFETHHFKERGEDGSVQKDNDDGLDALRYFIFSYEEQSTVREMRKKRAKIMKKNRRKRRY